MKAPRVPVTTDTSSLPSQDQTLHTAAPAVRVLDARRDGGDSNHHSTGDGDLSKGSKQAEADKQPSCVPVA